MTAFSTLLWMTACKSPVVAESGFGVVHVSPGDGAQQVAADAVITATFTQNLDEGSVTESTAYVLDSAGVPVSTTIGVDGAVVTLTPNQPLAESTRHIAILAAGIETAGGDSLGVDLTVEFTTTGPGSVSQGNGNNRPTAVAGEYSAVTAGESWDLSAADSSDPDGDLLTVQWDLVSQPPGSTATLSANDSESTSLASDTPGTYIVQLIVSDGALQSSPDYAILEAAVD